MDSLLEPLFAAIFKALAVVARMIISVILEVFVEFLLELLIKAPIRWVASRFHKRRNRRPVHPAVDRIRLHDFPHGFLGRPGAANGVGHLVLPPVLREL